MRFKKGSKVEVMNKKGHAHAYNVRYYGYEGVEKVSVRKKIGSKICEEEDDCLQKSHVVASRNLKRSSPFSSSVYEPVQKVKKVKPGEKDGNQRRYVSCHSYKKVDNNILNGYYDEMEKRKTNGVSRISDPNDESNSDQCSVGSCSVDNHSDGEFLNIVSDDDVAMSIHRLELHAYRSTLEAIYASGPLSWEKEALLTNLRINLHISNDEHLIELRHLIYSGVN